MKKEILGKEKTRERNQKKRKEKITLKKKRKMELKESTKKNDQRETKKSPIFRKHLDIKNNLYLHWYFSDKTKLFSTNSRFCRRNKFNQVTTFIQEALKVVIAL